MYPAEEFKKNFKADLTYVDPGIRKVIEKFVEQYNSAPVPVPFLVDGYDCAVEVTSYQENKSSITGPVFTWEVRINNSFYEVNHYVVWKFEGLPFQIRKLDYFICMSCSMEKLRKDQVSDHLCGGINKNI
jgi:hypothetical protein